MFNDRLLRQNAELAQYAADAAKETRELRDAIGGRMGARDSDNEHGKVKNCTATF